MAHEYKDIIYTKQDGVGIITLNRPDSLNALGGQLVDDWLAAIEEAKYDDEVRALVVTGAGRAFCAGMDVKGAAKRSQEAPPPLASQRNHMRTGIHRVPRALVDFDKPYIAAINGPATGAGMDMATMCDIRIASDRARVGMAYVRMGLIPGDGGCFFLPRVVGIAKACELIWTGRLIDAEEMLRIGYVSRVVPHEELMPATLEFARELAEGPAVAIQLAKRMIYRCLNLDMNIALELAEQAMLVARSTEDAKEGPRAFVEKRKPVFQGR